MIQVDVQGSRPGCAVHGEKPLEGQINMWEGDEDASTID